MSYARSSDIKLVEGMTQEQVCQHFRKKVLLLARRLGCRLGGGGPLDIEDLVSVGIMGLLDAFNRYDPTLGVRFTTFAEYRIRGAMLDAVREMDTFSRRRRGLSRRIENTTNELSIELGRPPDHEEIAERLDLDMEEYWAARESSSPDVSFSIDDPQEDGESVEGYLLAARTGTDGEDALRKIMRQDLRKLLRESILDMPERTQQCIILYYGRDFSLAEIAALFDITIARVSQIISEARVRLRRKLEAHINQEDIAWMEAP